MKRLIAIGMLLALSGCGTHGEGERCNPLRATSDCDTGLSCVYPTAPNCGVSYCCVVDAKGHIEGTNPKCRPDPSLDAVCMLDLGTTD